MLPSFVKTTVTKRTIITTAHHYDTSCVAEEVEFWQCLWWSAYAEKYFQRAFLDQGLHIVKNILEKSTGFLPSYTGIFIFSTLFAQDKLRENHLVVKRDALASVEPMYRFSVSGLDAGEWS